MVKRVVGAAIGLLVLGALGALIWLNPAVVDFQFAREQTLRLPLGWLLVFTFAAGIAATVLLVSFQQLIRRIVGWRQRRRDKNADVVAGWERSALTLGWEGEIERSRALLHKAYRRGDDNHGAALALASSYMETGEPQRAQRLLQEVVTYDANDADVRVALAEALRRNGEPNEAIRMLETVRVQYPRAARSLLALRELYREAGRWSDAAQVQTAYVSGLPAAARNGAETERLADLQYLAAQANTSVPARINALTTLLEQHRNHVPSVVALGDALVAEGRTDDAMRLWERALRTSPCITIADRLFTLQTNPRDRQKMLATFAKVPGMTSDTVHYYGARAAIDEGNYDGAATELEQLSDRTIPIVQRLWAEVHRQRGAIREAIKALLNVADAEPSKVGGFPCPVCQRISAPGSELPACKYWDGVRLLQA